MPATAPTPGQVAFGVAVVVVACLTCAYALATARRSGNWLYLVIAVGLAGVVAGVVGQRTFPSQDAVKLLGQAAAARQVPGPWEAGVHIPVVNLQATPVAVGGALLGVVGLSLVLFFEPVEPARRRALPAPLAPIEDDDTV